MTDQTHRQKTGVVGRGGHGPQKFHKTTHGWGQFYEFLQMTPKNFILHNDPEENFLVSALIESQYKHKEISMYT